MYDYTLFQNGRIALVFPGHQGQIQKSGFVHATDKGHLLIGFGTVLLDGIDYVSASVYCDDHSGSDVTDVSADASFFNLTLYDAGTTMVSVDFYAEDGSVMAERDFIIPVL